MIIYDFRTDRYLSYLTDSLIEKDVRTMSEEEVKFFKMVIYSLKRVITRTLYFNADGSLRWTHVNRAKDGSVHLVGWSRILYTQKDIQTINNFLNGEKLAMSKFNLFYCFRFWF